MTTLIKCRDGIWRRSGPRPVDDPAYFEPTGHACIDCYVSVSAYASRCQKCAMKAEWKVRRAAKKACVCTRKKTCETCLQWAEKDAVKASWRQHYGRTAA